MKFLVSLFLVMSLTACGTLSNLDLSNRVACSVAKDRGFVVSMWQVFGIASDLDAKDTEVLCK